MTPIEHSIFAFNFSVWARGRQPAAFHVAVMAAALAPDVDGLSVVFGTDAYVRYHRTFGHGALPAVVLGVAAAELVLTFMPQRLRRLASGDPEAGRIGLSWQGLIFAGAIGGLSHLLADALYPWPVPFAWPFSSAGFCWPILPWGDMVIACLLIASMFAHALAPKHARGVSAATFAVLGAYLVLRILSHGVGLL